MSDDESIFLSSSSESSEYSNESISEESVKVNYVLPKNSVILEIS